MRWSVSAFNTENRSWPVYLLSSSPAVLMQACLVCHSTIVCPNEQKSHRRSQRNGNSGALDLCVRESGGSGKHLVCKENLSRKCFDNVFMVKQSKLMQHDHKTLLAAVFSSQSFFPFPLWAIYIWMLCCRKSWGEGNVQYIGVQQTLTPLFCSKVGKDNTDSTVGRAANKQNTFPFCFPKLFLLLSIPCSCEGWDGEQGGWRGCEMVKPTATEDISAFFSLFVWVAYSYWVD